MITTQNRPLTTHPTFSPAVIWILGEHVESAGVFVFLHFWLGSIGASEVLPNQCLVFLRAECLVQCPPDPRGLSALLLWIGFIRRSSRDPRKVPLCL